MSFIKNLIDQFLGRYKLPTNFKMTDMLQRIVDRWKLSTEELAYFYYRFQQSDRNKSNSVEFDEFWSFLQESRSRFQDTMFELIVQDLNEQLDFGKWMVAVFSFSFMTPTELVDHVFRCYDKTQAGTLNLEDVHNFLASVHTDNPIFPADIYHAMTEAVKSKGGKLEYDDFIRASHKYPLLMYPVFKMQLDMRVKLIGRKLFTSLDARSGDVVYSTEEQDKRKVTWKKRKQLVELLVFGWNCCRKKLLPYEEDRRKKIEKAINDKDKRANDKLDVIGARAAKKEENLLGAEFEGLAEEAEAAERKEKGLKDFESSSSEDEFIEVNHDEYENDLYE